MMNTCPDCGEILNCTVQHACWCFELPNILEINDTGKCFCRKCTLSLIAGNIEAYLTELTSDKREYIKSLGVPVKLIENIDYYINEAGDFVFTQWYHLRRGFCCGNGCINCGWKQKRGKGPERTSI